jgi:hypothetical protein
LCFLEVVFADFLAFFRFAFELGLEVEENEDRFDKLENEEKKN